MQPPQPQPEPAANRRAPSTCSPAQRRSGGIGCMAGLLRLISPYHRSHHRKRLTAKNAPAARASQAPPPPPSSSSPRKKAAAQQPSASPAASPTKPTVQQLMTTAVRRRRSCDAPRSPTIAPEHRRSSCDSPRAPPPAIIARLMGLEESAPSSPAATLLRPVVPSRPPPPPPAAAPETAAEKRRKLLGALEKCDEDLKTLRRIIAAVRAAEMRAASASEVCPAAAKTTAHAGKGATGTFARDNEHVEQSPSPSPSPPTQQQQHPSPDSVLDAISSPRFPCRKRPSPCTDLDVGGKGGACGAVGSKIVKPSRTLVFSAMGYVPRNFNRALPYVQATTARSNQAVSCRCTPSITTRCRWRWACRGRPGRRAGGTTGGGGSRRPRRRGG
uniref:DUF3741 domain-containing protein n=1 Tax=Zea mays TaxID=4577 RepID=A0A804LJB6_MAIZE